WIEQNVTLSAPRLPYVSNVTGTLATAEQVTDPAYWAEHMCAPVQFDAALATLLRAEADAVLPEIGPGQSLGAMARGHRDCARERWPLVTATLPGAQDPRPATAVLAEAAGRLWLAGAPIDWAGYRQDRPVAKAGLPTYPFQRERYWVDPPATARGSLAAAAGSANGTRDTVPGAGGALSSGGRGGALAASPGTAGAAGTSGAAAPDEPHVRLMATHWTPAPEAASAATPAVTPPARCILLTGPAEAGSAEAGPAEDGPAEAGPGEVGHGGEGAAGAG